MQPADWFWLSAILGSAVAIRLLFHTGFFGSDEVTYILAALRIAAGDWQASNYIGATRYGMNLPLALFIDLLGLSEASTNLWPFLCSVGEVALVFIIARWIWSTRTAVIAAVLLALLPLHVHIAGRMLADAPLAFFLTLSVALLLHAAASKRRLGSVAAGLAWGGVFWVKESVGLLYLPLFLFFNFLLAGFSGRWLSLLGGMCLAIIANCLLMIYVANNPLHIFAVIGKGLGGYSDKPVETSAWYYLRYLLVDIRHTFLLGYLVVAGIILHMKHQVRDHLAEAGTHFIVMWVLLLTGLFSLAIISFSPVKLVMKQHNYMLIFIGPMTLLAGWFLANLPRRILVPLGSLMVLGSVVLSALEQQAITVFTANSKAAYVFLRDRPTAYLVGTSNNERAINYFSMMESRSGMLERISSLDDLAASAPNGGARSLAAVTLGKDVFALVDMQTIDWGRRPGGIRRASDVPKCWTPLGELVPTRAGSGHWVVKSLVAVGAILPNGLREKFMVAIQPVWAPAPAFLFKIEQDCLTQKIG